MSQPDPLVGGTLASTYRVLRLLGVGRTGRVYAALDSRRRRKVAIKVLHPALAEVDEHLARFQREFEAAACIEHPNTVQMLGLEKDGEHSFIVMELLEGRRLDELLETRRKLSVRRTVRIAIQVADALAAAHAHGVVHRDLNPANVMLLKPRRPGDGERVKVLDFGLARWTGAEHETLTGFGERLGREHYMSPEYVRHAELDARSDLYALGCLLYAMLTGRPPFIGPSMKVLDGHATLPVTTPAAEVPNLPDWLENLVMSLLAKSPEDRPQSAQEVSEVLNRHFARLDPADDDETSQATSGERLSTPSLLATGLAHAPVPEDRRPPASTGLSPLEWALRFVLGLGLLVGSAALTALITSWWLTR